VRETHALAPSAWEDRWSPHQQSSRTGTLVALWSPARVPLAKHNPAVSLLHTKLFLGGYNPTRQTPTVKTGSFCKANPWCVGNPPSTTGLQKHRKA